jgi:hypothetical protein
MSLEILPCIDFSPVALGKPVLYEQVFAVKVFPY